MFLLGVRVSFRFRFRIRVSKVRGRSGSCRSCGKGNIRNNMEGRGGAGGAWCVLRGVRWFRVVR